MKLFELITRKGNVRKINKSVHYSKGNTQSVSITDSRNRKTFRQTKSIPLSVQEISITIIIIIEILCHGLRSNMGHTST